VDTLKHGTPGWNTVEMIQGNLQMTSTPNQLDRSLRSSPRLLCCPIEPVVPGLHHLQHLLHSIQGDVDTLQLHVQSGYGGGELSKLDGVVLPCLADLSDVLRDWCGSLRLTRSLLVLLLLLMSLLLLLLSLLLLSMLVLLL
jgi:hypothetical protein